MKELAEIERLGLKLPLEIVEGFVIEEVIGEGFTSLVYRASLTKPRWGLSTGSNIALKVFKQKLTASELKRIKREVEIGTSIFSAYLPRYFDTLLLKIGPFNFFAVAMEFISGVSLKQFLNSPSRQKRPLKESMVYTWLIQVATGLDALHQNGIVHRDIHPGNIIICNKSGKNCQIAKLVDFGLAREIRPKQFEVVTQQWEEIGARRYWAPECLTTNSNRWAPKTDLYMLGATFFHYLTGKLRYHDCKSYYEFYQILANLDPYDPVDIKVDNKLWGRLEGKYSREFIMILKSLLNKFSEQRPFSADMLKRLTPPLKRHIIDIDVSKLPSNSCDSDYSSLVERRDGRHLGELTYTIGEFYLSEHLESSRLFHLLLNIYPPPIRFQIKDIYQIFKLEPTNEKLVGMIVKLLDWGILCNPEPMVIGARKKSYVLDFPQGGRKDYWYVCLDEATSFEFSNIAVQIRTAFDDVLSLEKFYALLTTVYHFSGYEERLRFWWKMLRSKYLKENMEKKPMIEEDINIFLYHLQSDLREDYGFYSSFDKACKAANKISSIYWIYFDDELLELRHGGKTLARCLLMQDYAFVDGFSWTRIFKRPQFFHSLYLWLLQNFELIPVAFEQVVRIQPSEFYLKNDS